VNTLIGLAVVVAAFALAMWLFARLAARIRRQGIGTALMGPVEEVWKPSNRRYRIEIEAEAQTYVPIEAPGDRPKRTSGG
jgi:hypothetical protein